MLTYVILNHLVCNRFIQHAVKLFQNKAYLQLCHVLNLQDSSKRKIQNVGKRKYHARQDNILTTLCIGGKVGHMRV